MGNESKSKLQEALEDQFECHSYSGRGMYGQRCLACEVEPGDVGSLFSAIARAAYEHGINSDRAAANELADQASHVQFDQMGRRFVFYFPHVEFVEEGS